MFIDDKKRALSRILIGGGLGVLGCLLLGWLSQPGALFGGSLTWEFRSEEHTSELQSPS